jgi:glycerol-3-phosphate acyltransferase PlsX
LVARQPKLSGRVTIRHAPAASMEDKPSHVLRRGKDTSMWRTLSGVKPGDADGGVSAGNTGA